MKRKSLYPVFSAGSVPLIIVCGLIFAAMGGVNGSRCEKPVRAADGREMKRLDGDRNGKEVVFSHSGHAVIVKGRGGDCETCHHLNLPAEEPVPCSRCHSRMYHTSSIFNHDRHADLFKTDGAYCRECHGSDRSREHVKKCDDCHGEYDRPVIYYTRARGYKHAMHASCLECHKREDARRGRTALSECGYCHQDLNKAP